MTAQFLNSDTRVNVLKAVLSDNGQQQEVENQLKLASGDWSKAVEVLKTTLPAETLQRVEFANSLAVLSEDNIPIIKAIVDQPNLGNLRDVALQYNVERLASLVDPQTIPASITGANDEEKKKNFAIILQQKLFNAEPSAVLQRMVQEQEIHISNDKLRTGVTTFLNNQPDYNIRTTSIYHALNNPDAFKDIAEDQRPNVVNQLKTLQRVQAISHLPEVIPALIKANLTSAYQVGEMPESNFIRAFSQSLGSEDNARQVYTNAINVRIRNEQALVTMRESMRGTGLAIIDGKETMEERITRSQEVADNQSVPINLTTIFGDMDYCECEECTSVYSPASYYVELLQFLRNNNSDPNNSNTGQKGIKGTPLEKLFFRRPDLGCLELTCQNTNTVLPYIDLANEVMESFVVHLDKYEAEKQVPKQSIIDVFNVEDETSSELLAQPQHTNYEAYCILKSAVYPFTLPYHQPIDAIRTFLNYLGTSRYELLDKYRSAYEVCGDSTEEQQKLQDLHQITLDRAVEAEYLGLTQEEYIILTKEAFWPKSYFDITQKTTFTNDEYQRKIGVKDVWEYFGYSTKDDILSTDEDPTNGQKGLTFVKKQFLPRTGIQYVDLVELLKTQFINPNYPQGKALTILESLQFSYRFLQTFVDATSNDPKIKFAKLIEFLEKDSQKVLAALHEMLHPDPCHQDRTETHISQKDLRNWVYCYFERIGQLIVLESGENLQLPIEGHSGGVDGGTLNPGSVLLKEDGSLIAKGQIVGHISVVVINGVPIAGPPMTLDGKPLLNGTDQNVEFLGDNNKPVAKLNQNGLFDTKGNQIAWLLLKGDNCDLSKVRLTHLDGTQLESDEYDKIQRFIRLWNKLGWTIDETDKAIIGLTIQPSNSNGATPSTEDCNYVSFEVFEDDCVPAKAKGNTDGSSDGVEEDWNCPDINQTPYDITPDFLHQLVAIQKLLDRTGLPLEKLLVFWADISTVGDNSLYTNLFLTHNMLGIDKVFKADIHGNYLTKATKISEHIPVLMAAFNLKADDITLIVQFKQLTDELTLSNISTIYRYRLLSKLLGIRVIYLPEVVGLFGDPFVSAYQTLSLFETWGKMEDAGFTFQQLNYIIKGHDDTLRPIAPTKRTILQITKTLYDGLNAITFAHPDVDKSKPEAATSDLVRTKAGLIFDQDTVEKIVGLLEGTTVYTTIAPANQTITIADTDSLSKKLKYTNKKDSNPPSATLQVTGILTDDEMTRAKSLLKNAVWEQALDQVNKQPLRVLNDILFGIFPDLSLAKVQLLAGDVSVPVDQIDPSSPDPNTAPQKRLYFLTYFIPFLRQRLAHRLVVDTVSTTTNLSNEITDLLLSEVINIGTGSQLQSAIDVLEKVQEKPAESATDWKGYLTPSADDNYTFIVKSDSTPAPILIDGQSISFPYQQEDPSNIWSTDPIKLKSGKLYWLETPGQSAEQLQWKTSSTPPANIPASSLLPDYSSQTTEQVFTIVYKLALLVNGFNLNTDEITYLSTHGDDFSKLDFNNITLTQWLRLQSYCDLRNSLPKVETTLIDLFKWASQPDKTTTLTGKIAAATTWKVENIQKLMATGHFNLEDPQNFRNETALILLRDALAVSDKIGMDIDSLFEWAKPGSKFWECHKIAEDIRKAIRSRYNQEDWEQVVQPLNDKLRENQKLALISYLLIQQPLIDWGVTDADGLFEFFLIDVQMEACMETSRIKQAISTIQLFVQRCFLGLEVDKSGIQVDDLDRGRWEWMQKYRVWEANREVFLYPENWIDPTLRDDKSSFYKELEAELLQKDINTQTVEDALKNYLFKVDEVANLKVVGLFQEQRLDENGKFTFDSDGNPVYSNLHIFSRSRNAPYFFYYRYYDILETNWYPWEKVQVDIPSYDLEDNNGNITENGSYLIPVVWNKRLLIFFPQIIKKTVANKNQGDLTVTTSKDENGNSSMTVPFTAPQEVWEIKMGWSENRNGKWTQKQLSSQAIYDPVPPNSFPDIDTYDFVPRFITDSSNHVTELVIDVYQSNKVLANAFHFNGSQINTSGKEGNDFNIDTDFQYQKNPNSVQIYSLQALNDAPPTLYNQEPYFVDGITSGTIQITVDNTDRSFNFYHAFVHELLGTLTSDNLDDLFGYFQKNLPDTSQDGKNKADAYGDNGTSATTGDKIYSELKQPYSLYNWETSFHAPMELADKLLKAQQFDQALKMCQYIFNPLAGGPDIKDCWQFPPFQIDATQVLQKLFQDINSGNKDAISTVNEWRDKPFEPHVVARTRPVAYMKWVVMKYIEILIAYGDYYFRQNTLETIPMAIQCYVMAAHLYGPRGQKIPKRGKTQPQTYNSLLDKWDAFGNAMVELELIFPFSNQTTLPYGNSNGVVGLANVFGFATSLYFCIPDNPQLTGLRDTIDDRLFKIRHCEDIEGVFRVLPLFEPPIDPGLLVQAVAQGLSLTSVLNDLNSPMPNYRFYYLLQKALELCSELKTLGNAYLSAKEKSDGEALSRLRAKHESSINNLIMEVKKQQVEEAGKSLDALQYSRKSPEYRLQHHLKLLGLDTSMAPDSNTEFKEIEDPIEPPVEESGLKLMVFEKEESDKASEAKEKQVTVAHLEILSNLFHILPTFSVDVHPFGAGTDIQWGTPNLANGLEAIAKSNQIDANDSSYQSTNAGRKAGFQRQIQDRVLQANTIGYEIKNIDKQILTQQIRINITQQEITNQQKQIDNSQEVEDYLRSKYTNQELYDWMDGQLQTLYYQAYTLAYDLAKKAEKAYRFERGLSTSNFIQFGYWDAGYDGLLAGEKLYIGLKQLEAAYQEKRGYDFEVSKQISLRQTNPLALIQLRETGSCEFALPEVLFDMDYPGHYMRRIKSVALTVPCVVGPYTSLNCTLRLLEHKFRLNSIAKDKNDYPERTDDTDDRFSTTNIPITSIAVSNGQNDSGVFELNFHDERYIPFEGAGVISKWRVELPESFRQFDYDTISDVILHVRYTSCDGGDKLKKPASDTVQEYIKSVAQLSKDEGLFALFDLKSDFPTEWYKANHPLPGATDRTFLLNNLNDRLPIFTKGRNPQNIQATNLYLFTSTSSTLGSLSAADLTLSQDTNEFHFTDGDPNIGSMKSFVIDGLNCPISSWQLKLKDMNAQLEKIWLLVRFTLK